jgi:predicted transcriptional regulator
MTEIMDKLRDKDEIVLQAVHEGNDDIQKITETTTLENHEVNYCFSKLEDLNLITIEKPDGYTTRNINGQKRVFQTPKQAKPTDKGKQHLEKVNIREEDQFKNIGQGELIELVRAQEQRIERLETAVEMLKRKFQNNV